jgi:hypothetical protein
MLIHSTLSITSRSTSTGETPSLFVLTTSIMTGQQNHHMYVSDRRGVHQKREYVTEASASVLKIPKLDVDDVVSEATMSEHSHYLDN